jgi:hypothetical protein
MSFYSPSLLFLPDRVPLSSPPSSPPAASTAPASSSTTPPVRRHHRPLHPRRHPPPCHACRPRATVISAPGPCDTSGRCRCLFLPYRCPRCIPVRHLRHAAWSLPSIFAGAASPDRHPHRPHRSRHIPAVTPQVFNHRH